MARLLLRERGGKKAIDFNRISPQTLLVCCCYASIWRSLFINERVRSVAKTLRARICVIKLRAGWSDLAGDGGGGRWASGMSPAAPLSLEPPCHRRRHPRSGGGAGLPVPPPDPCSLPSVLLNTKEADFPLNQAPREEWRRREHCPAAAGAGFIGHRTPCVLCSPTFVKPLQGASL